MVSRPRLIERLNAGLHRKLTLISAPAGFGKTTLLSERGAGCGWTSVSSPKIIVYLVAYDHRSSNIQIDADNAIASFESLLTAVFAAIMNKNSVLKSQGV